jgi:AcrR family transcriptional regulator
VSTDTRTRAMSVYAAHGYRGTSLEAVAREVGVRKPTLYHHLPGGKETLPVWLRAVVRVNPVTHLVQGACDLMAGQG